MGQPGPEKRSIRRVPLDLPISVKFLDNGRRELAGHTRDVSARGVFMYLETEIRVGTPIEFVMTLPQEITLSGPIRVRCSGTVLRVEKNGDEQGVGVSIHRYDYLNDNEE